MLEFRYTTFNRRVLLRSIMASAALIGVAMTPNVAFADTFEDIENSSGNIEATQKSNEISNDSDDIDTGVKNNTKNSTPIQNDVQTTNADNQNEDKTDLKIENISNVDLSNNNLSSTLVENKLLTTGQNQLLNAASEPSVSQTGVSGTCTWTLYDDGSLIIAPTDPNAESGQLSAPHSYNSYRDTPWAAFRDSIKSVKFEKNVKAYKSCDYMFSELSNLTSIDFTNFDTSDVTNMDNMFYNCQNLTSLDLSGFDTSKVTNMKGMFRQCLNLATVDLSSFNTSNVVDMSGMFTLCQNLTSLGLSNFNVSSVTNMSNMFNNCQNLETLDLSNFDAPNLTNMSYIFSQCENLTSINLSNFNAPNLENVSYMFSQCKNLTSIDLSSFSTSNLKNMASMFNICTNLNSINFNNFNTSKVTNMSSMFWSCQSLTSLDLSNFNTPNVTDISYMFCNSARLASLDLSNFDTSSVTNMRGMFSNTGLKLLKLSNKCIFNETTQMPNKSWVDTNNIIYENSSLMLNANRTAPETYRTFQYRIGNMEISNIGDQTYSGKSIEPSPLIRRFWNTYINLVEGTDYELIYSNNINAGEATITIIGKGDYAGITTKTFNIIKSDAATLDAAAIFEVDIPDTMTYGDNVNVTVTTKDGITGVGDVSVEYSSDSGVTWTDDTPKNVGTYDIRVTITGGDNVGSGVFTNPNWKIVILAKTFDGAETDIEPNSDVYTGKPVAITSLIVTSEGETLTEGVDYSVTYLDANGDTISPDKIIDSGVYTVKITCMNGYINSDITVNFTIKKADQAPIRASMLSVRRNNIAGVNRLMEYSNDNGTVWTSVPNDTTELTGLIEDSKYLVRFKGDNNHNPSEPIILTTGNNKVDNSSSDNNDTKPIVVDDKEPSNNTNDDTSKPSVKPDNKKDNTIKANRSLPETNNNATNGSKNDTEMNGNRNGAEVSATPETGDNMSNGVGLLAAILSSGLLSGLSLYMARRRKKSDSN